VKQVVCLGGISGKEGGGKEMVLAGEEDENTFFISIYLSIYLYIYTCIYTHIYDDSIMKSTKCCWKSRGGKEG
jgi:hypothetical protein